MLSNFFKQFSLSLQGLIELLLVNINKFLKSLPMRKIFFPVIFLLYSLSCFAQNNDILEPKGDFFDRFVFGGGLGLQFGTLTFIEISPVIGYKVTHKLESGIGLTYKYYKYKDFYVDQTTGQRIDLKSDMYGASVYSRYHFLENFFAHIEFERLRFNDQNIYSSGGQIIREPFHTYINGLFLGGGIQQNISKGSFLYVMALWDLIEDPNSPYQNPIIRMGIMLGRNK